MDERILKEREHLNTDPVRGSVLYNIRIEDEEHSREVQEYLFRHGASWTGTEGDCDVRHTDQPNLVVRTTREGKIGIWFESSPYNPYEEDAYAEAWFYNGAIHFRSPPPTTKLPWPNPAGAQEGFYTFEDAMGGRPIVLNIQHIVAIEELMNGAVCLISTSDGRAHQANGSLRDLMELIFKI